MRRRVTPPRNGGSPTAAQADRRWSRAVSARSTSFSCRRSAPQVSTRAAPLSSKPRSRTWAPKRSRAAKTTDRARRSEASSSTPSSNRKAVTTWRRSAEPLAMRPAGTKARTRAGGSGVTGSGEAGPTGPGAGPSTSSAPRAARCWATTAPDTAGPRTQWRASPRGGRERPTSNRPGATPTRSEKENRCPPAVRSGAAESAWSAARPAATAAASGSAMPVNPAVTESPAKASTSPPCAAIAWSSGSKTLASVTARCSAPSSPSAMSASHSGVKPDRSANIAAPSKEPASEPAAASACTARGRSCGIRGA